LLKARAVASSLKIRPGAVNTPSMATKNVLHSDKKGEKNNFENFLF
jgi:hypothetical protein